MYNTSNRLSFNTRGGALYIHCVGNTHITIANSNFTNTMVGSYTGGGLYIYPGSDTHNNITITNSVFTNNTMDNGDGGGLAIYSDNDINVRNNVSIISSMFVNNRAGNGGDGGGVYMYSNNGRTRNNIIIIDSVFAANVAPCFGGGLYISPQNRVTVINSTFASNAGNCSGGGLMVNPSSDADIINITNSTFSNNTAINHGGGLFLTSSPTTCNSIIITNSIFIYNKAFKNGGGLHTSSSGNITITSSTFIYNRADSGGGLYISSHANVVITESTFTDNTAIGNGGGLHIDSGTDIDVVIINSTFTSNKGSGLSFYPTEHSNISLSQMVISNNSQSGILVFNQVTVVFTGRHSIVANNSSPADGGGIFLGKDCYLTTSNGGHVSFINNTAHRYGGAIYSLANDYTLFNVKVYERTFDDQCTTIHDLSATFINNSAAIAGDQLYGGQFIFCDKSSQVNLLIKTYIFECHNMPAAIKTAPSVHPLSPVSSDPIAVCPCVNDTIDCSIMSLDREIYPGQILHVSLVTVGLCGGVSPGTVVVEHDKKINIISNTTDYISTSCTTLGYTVKPTTYIISNTTFKINVANGDIHDSIWPIDVKLTILPCPTGLVHAVNSTSMSGDCVCNNIIAHMSGVMCNVSWMPYPIERSGNNWISYQIEYGKESCTIAHIGCPFDYCNTSPVKFALNESDLQCNYNRSGILCGQCIQGLSLMIGSNRCTNCTDMKLVSVSIVIVATVAGVVLVILLMLLNLTVSVGSINGLLFYANLVKLNESVFFSSGNIPVITQFISWCNLDMGFEYCFVDGLDGYVKTWLQFVFPLYVWFLVIVIILGCRYSGRLSRFCGSNAIPVLATLILMSYTKLSRTVTNALMINTLQCGEYKWSVWNVDGNIDYLGGKHAILFTVSLLFLITGLVYTGLVFSSQWLQRYSGKCCKSTRDPVVRLKPLIDAYTGPFKDKYRFWTGLCLIVHLVLTVVFSFTPTLQSRLINNYIILLTVGAMIVFTNIGGKFYKDKRLTILEIFSYVNIISLCVMTVLFTDSYSHVVSINVIVSVSVSIEILLFIIIVIVHCYLALKKGFPNCKLCCKT